MSMTWEEAQHLVSLVNAAKTILDLDVVPVRVWRLVGKCERHGQVKHEEFTLPLTEAAPETILCALCFIGKYEPARVPCEALLLRG